MDNVNLGSKTVVMKSEIPIKYLQNFEENDRDKDSWWNIYTQARKYQFVDNIPPYYVSTDRRASLINSQEQLVERSTDTLREKEEQQTQRKDALIPLNIARREGRMRLTISTYRRGSHASVFHCSPNTLNIAWAVFSETDMTAADLWTVCKLFKGIPKSLAKKSRCGSKNKDIRLINERIPVRLSAFMIECVRYALQKTLIKR